MEYVPALFEFEGWVLNLDTVSGFDKKIQGERGFIEIYYLHGGSYRYTKDGSDHWRGAEAAYGAWIARRKYLDFIGEGSPANKLVKGFAGLGVF